MSKIFNQLKTLEARIRKERHGANNNQQESEKSPKAAPHVGIKSQTVIAPPPLKRGGVHRNYYLAAALLALITGLVVVSGIHPTAEKPPVKPEVQAPRQVARYEAVAVKPKQNEESRVRQTIQQWAEAWSRRDDAAYLSFYADDFNVPEGLTRADWLAQRKTRLRKYRTIAVTLGGIEILLIGGDQAKADFTQDFQSESYKETGVKKELVLRNANGQWLIVSEKML